MRIVQAVSYLMFEGHNAEFLRITNLVQKLDKREYELLLAQVSDDERLRMKFVRPRVHSLKSIRGWDLGRYVSLCRWGYAAGYLTEKEAWAEILNVSRVLQSHFSSWKEYGENFLLGRRFYSLDQAPDWATMTRIEHQLTTDAASPWVQIPWHTELD